MKFMKIVLSVVAIAAIATIYSTGAFVSQTPGMDNTVDGFLAISNAEMAQQVGGHHIVPDEGIKKKIDGQDYSKHCDESGGNVCLKSDHHRKEFNAPYYVCANCLPRVVLFNINNCTFSLPYARYSDDFEVPEKIIITCYFNDEGDCEPNVSKSLKKRDSCEKFVGVCP